MHVVVQLRLQPKLSGSFIARANVVVVKLRFHLKFYIKSSQFSLHHSVSFTQQRR